MKNKKYHNKLIYGGKCMSTRAIIGIKNEDGTVTGGWQWNDGMKLISKLRNHFNTLEKVQELVKNGIWNNIVFPKDKDTLEHFTEWTKKENSDYYLVPVGKCYLLKEKPFEHVEYCFNGENGITINDDGSMTFADVDTAFNQDINYLYLYYPETNTWKTFYTWTTF